MTNPAPSQGLAMGAAEWAMLLTLSLLWGGSFFFVGVAVQDLPTLTIVLLRVGLAAATLWLVVWRMGVPVPKGPAIWAAFFAMGLLNNLIPFGLIVWGQASIASGLASILNGTTPLFTAIVAGALLADERLTAAKLAGVALGFAGVALMVGPDALAGLGDAVLAQAAVLGAAVSYAFAAVFGRRFRESGLDPIAVAAGQVTASTLMLAPIAFAMDTPWRLPAPSPETMAAILGLAVFFDRPRLYPLFPHSGAGGRGQSLAGDLSDPSLGHRPRRALPGRAAFLDGLRRRRLDRRRARRHRRQALPAAQAAKLSARASVQASSARSSIMVAS